MLLASRSIRSQPSRVSGRSSSLPFHARARPRCRGVGNSSSSPRNYAGEWQSSTWQTRLLHSESAAPRKAIGRWRRRSTGARRALFPSASAVTDRWDQERVGYTYGLYGTPTSLELAARICAARRRAAHAPDARRPIRDLADRFRAAQEPATTSSFRSASIVRTGSSRRRLLCALRRQRDVLRSRRSARAIAALMNDEYAVDLDREPGLGDDGGARHSRDRGGGACTRRDRRDRQHVGGGRALRRVCARRRRHDAGDYEIHRRAQRSATRLGHGSRRRALPAHRRGSTGHRLRRFAGRLQSGAARTADARGASARRSKRRRSRLRAGSPTRPEVELVLHPALPSCPGHEFWRRDFSGSSGVFSIVLRPGPSREQVFAFVDALELFEIGYSWAGTTSLAVAYTIAPQPNRPPYDHRLVRFSIGLESTQDLIADLERALLVLKR